MAREFPLRTRQRMLEEFGDGATVNGQAVRGVFANTFVEIRGAEATAPSLLCRVESVPEVVAGQAVSIAARGFVGQVASVQPDGEGWVLLVLHRTA